MSINDQGRNNGWDNTLCKEQTPDTSPTPTTEEFIANLVSAAEPVTVLKSHRVRFLRWLFISVISVGVTFQLLGLRRDISTRLTEPLFLFESFIMIFMAILATSTAFALSVPGTIQTRLQKYGVFGFMTAWIGMSLYRLSTGTFEFSDGLVGYGCAADTLALGVVPGILLFYMIRSAANIRPGMSGALILIGSLGMAAFCVRYSCSFEHPGHLLTAHILPVLVLGVAGIYVGKVILRWK